MYRVPGVDDEVLLVPDAVLDEPVAPVVLLAPVLGLASARTNWPDPLMEPVVPVEVEPVAVEPDVAPVVPDDPDMLAFSRQPTTVIVCPLLVLEVLGVCAETPIAHVAAIARPVAHPDAFIIALLFAGWVQGRHHRRERISRQTVEPRGRTRNQLRRGTELASKARRRLRR